MQQKLQMIDNKDKLSIRKQCNLLKINRSNIYYAEASESKENLLFMRLLDEEYTRILIKVLYQ